MFYIINNSIQKLYSPSKLQTLISKSNLINKEHHMKNYKVKLIKVGIGINQDYKTQLNELMNKNRIRLSSYQLNKHQTYTQVTITHPILLFVNSYRCLSPSRPKLLSNNLKMPSIHFSLVANKLFFQSFRHILDFLHDWKRFYNEWKG